MKLLERLRKLFRCYGSHRASGHSILAALRIAARHHKFIKRTTT